MAKIGEGFWPISGVPEGTARVSVVSRGHSFLTEIFRAGVASAKKAQNVG